MKLITLAFALILSTFAFANDALIDAVKYKSLKEVKVLLDEGADPNTIDKNEDNGRVKPIIFHAVERERINVLKLLIKYGADLSLTKTANGVYANTILMVTVRKLALRESKGRMSEILTLLLNKEFEINKEKTKFEIDLYQKGGIDGSRDMLSVIVVNGRDVDLLSQVYSHKNISPIGFHHRNSYLRRSIATGSVDFLNLYLEFNADKVSRGAAKRALEQISSSSTSNLNLVNTELRQRLRSIAFD